jgi:hypothetical protein
VDFRAGLKKEARGNILSPLPGIEPLSYSPLQDIILISESVMNNILMKVSLQ